MQKITTPQLLAFSKATSSTSTGIKTGLPSTAVGPICKVSGAWRNLELQKKHTIYRSTYGNIVKVINNHPGSLSVLVASSAFPIFVPFPYSMFFEQSQISLFWCWDQAIHSHKWPNSFELGFWWRFAVQHVGKSATSDKWPFFTINSNVLWRCHEICIHYIWFDLLT